MKDLAGAVILAKLMGWSLVRLSKHRPDQQGTLVVHNLLARKQLFFTRLSQFPSGSPGRSSDLIFCTPCAGQAARL